MPLRILIIIVNKWTSPINADGRARKDKPLVLTYLQRAGAPHAQKRGPGCFSRPSVQASASLGALFPDHFGAGETAAGAEPRNPCFFTSTPEEKRKINNPLEEKEGGKKEKSYTNSNSRVLEMLGRVVKCGFRDASPSLLVLPAASLTLVGSADRPALRPPAPLLAIFLGLALLGNKDNRAIGRCSRWDHFFKS